MNRSRRQFFKTVAATAAGIVVGGAPRVVGGEKPEVGVGNRAKHLMYGDPGIGKTYMDIKPQQIRRLARFYNEWGLPLADEMEQLERQTMRSL